VSIPIPSNSINAKQSKNRTTSAASAVVTPAELDASAPIEALLHPQPPLHWGHRSCRAASAVPCALLLVVGGTAWQAHLLGAAGRLKNAAALLYFQTRLVGVLCWLLLGVGPSPACDDVGLWLLSCMHHRRAQRRHTTNQQKLTALADSSGSTRLVL